MKEEVVGVIDKLPARMLRPTLVLLMTILLAVGGVAGTMEWGWRAARISAESKLDERQDRSERQMTQLVEATSNLAKATANCQDEVKAYREEMKQLRHDQIEWARQLERALRDGRTR